MAAPQGFPSGEASAVILTPILPNNMECGGREHYKTIADPCFKSLRWSRTVTGIHELITQSGTMRLIDNPGVRSCFPGSGE